MKTTTRCRRLLLTASFFFLFPSPRSPSRMEPSRPNQRGCPGRIRFGVVGGLSSFFFFWFYFLFPSFSEPMLCRLLPWFKPVLSTCLACWPFFPATTRVLTWLGSPAYSVSSFYSVDPILRNANCPLGILLPSPLSHPSTFFRRLMRPRCCTPAYQIDFFSIFL